jgi:hypothetical protein
LAEEQEQSSAFTKFLKENTEEFLQNAFPQLSNWMRASQTSGDYKAASSKASDGSGLEGATQILDDLLTVSKGHTVILVDTYNLIEKGNKLLERIASNGGAGGAGGGSGSSLTSEAIVGIGSAAAGAIGGIAPEAIGGAIGAIGIAPEAIALAAGAALTYIIVQALDKYVQPAIDEGAKKTDHFVRRMFGTTESSLNAEDAARDAWEKNGEKGVLSDYYPKDIKEQIETEKDKKSNDSQIALLTTLLEENKSKQAHLIGGEDERNKLKQKEVELTAKLNELKEKDVELSQKKLDVDKKVQEETNKLLSAITPNTSSLNKQVYPTGIPFQQLDKLDQNGNIMKDANGNILHNTPTILQDHSGATGRMSGGGGGGATIAKGALAKNQKISYDKLISMGYDKESAKAAIAVVSGESLADPSNTHPDHSPSNPNQVAHGIASWDDIRSGEIKKHFHKMPNEMSVQEQWEAWDWEINTNKRFAQVKTALHDPNMSPEDKMRILINKHEVPADPQGQFNARMKFYNGLKVDGDSSGPPSMSAPKDSKEVLDHLQDMKNKGMITSDQCVALAMASVGVKYGSGQAGSYVKDWRRGDPVSEKMASGTSIATFLDTHGQVSDRYAGGGIGVEGAHRDHAGTLTGHRRKDKDGKVWYEMAEQWKNHLWNGGTKWRTFTGPAGTGGSENLANYAGINVQTKNGIEPLGGENDPNYQRKQKEAWNAAAGINRKKAEASFDPLSGISVHKSSSPFGDLSGVNKSTFPASESPYRKKAEASFDPLSGISVHKSSSPFGDLSGVNKSTFPASESPNAAAGINRKKAEASFDPLSGISVHKSSSPFGDLSGVNKSTFPASESPFGHLHLPEENAKAALAKEKQNDMAKALKESTTEDILHNHRLASASHTLVNNFAKDRSPHNKHASDYPRSVDLKKNKYVDPVAPPDQRLKELFVLEKAVGM